MMFNGLMMCTDSDSDFAKESISRSSELDSVGSRPSSAQAHHYRNQLIATQKILRNQEETVRVQAESLTVAEGRIAAFSAKVEEQRRELDRKTKELQLMKETEVESKKKLKCDISVAAEIHEMDNQKNIVRTLQNNLYVIEDLYRECFYETAKQEDLIEMLRQSYLDVRLSDRDKAEQISRLHGVIRQQNWSLDRCQDIAVDVENLKMDITNFLNNSNNDSGVWEETLAGGLTEDLQDISSQLITLRDLLAGDCTCALLPENKSLKLSNYSLEIKVKDLQKKINSLESTAHEQRAAEARARECAVQKDRELTAACSRLAATGRELAQKTEENQTLSRDLRQVTELLKALQGSYEEAMNVEQCDESYQTEGQNSAKTANDPFKCSQTSCGAVRQAEALESELAVAAMRGVAVCGAARRAARRVRRWARRMRDLQREQEDKIHEKDAQIEQLQQLLEERKTRAVSKTSICEGAGHSASEGDSYVTAPAPPPPHFACRCQQCNVGIQRPVRLDESCSCTSSALATTAGPARVLCQPEVTRVLCQPEVTRDCVCPVDDGFTSASPMSELVSRVEAARAALGAGLRRWGRRALSHTDH